MAMVERNGITFFDQNYPDHPAFRDLQGVSLGDVRFPFGFFLVNEKGKKVVIPGTRDDLIKRLLQALPKYPIDLISTTGVCTQFNDACEGGCSDFGSTFRCVKFHDQHNFFYGCGCVDFF
jgi:hypothetical protein